MTDDVKDKEEIDRVRTNLLFETEQPELKKALAKIARLEKKKNELAEELSTARKAIKEKNIRITDQKNEISQLLKELEALKKERTQLLDQLEQIKAEAIISTL